MRCLGMTAWWGGTTNTAMDASSFEPQTLPEERAFAMDHAKRYLHDDPTDADVLSVLAGLLGPLVKGNGSTSTAALSRDHAIMVSLSGLITVTGGKWTTYRKMTEDVVTQIEIVGGFEERSCRTVDLRLHGSGTNGNGRTIPSMPVAVIVHRSGVWRIHVPIGRSEFIPGCRIELGRSFGKFDTRWPAPWKTYWRDECEPCCWMHERRSNWRRRSRRSWRRKWVRIRPGGMSRSRRLRRMRGVMFTRTRPAWAGAEGGGVF